MSLIKVAAHDSPLIWRNQASVQCSGINDQNLINQQLVSGNEVDFGPGPANYICTGEIRTQSNVTFHGQGTKCTSYSVAAATLNTRPTINFTGVQYQSGIHVYTVTNVQCGMFNLAGVTDTGGIIVFPNSGNVDSIIFYDIYSVIKGVQTVLGCGNVFNIYATDYFGKVTNISYLRCWADSPDGFGFIIEGEGTNPIVDGITFYRCGVKNAGIASTRALVGDGSCWVCGIDIAEAPNMSAKNVTVIACSVDGAWLDDYHSEFTPGKTGIVYLDNIAKRAGQWANIAPPGYAYMAGFMMPYSPDPMPTQGKTSSDDLIMVGNQGDGTNIQADLALWEKDIGYQNTPCYDFSFSITGQPPKTWTRITQGNCTGIAVKNGTLWDVYLYSSDQNPVNQLITLPDGTPFTANFIDFLIQRNITPQPSGFIAGSSHTATFKTTVIPSGISYSVELWLGPNVNTKTATSGKIPMPTSTGNPQNVTATITMPTGGTYNVYIDLYYGTTILSSFVSTTVLVVSGTIGEPIWT